MDCAGVEGERPLDHVAGPCRTACAARPGAAADSRSACGQHRAGLRGGHLHGGPAGRRLDDGLAQPGVLVAVDGPGEGRGQTGGQRTPAARGRRRRRAPPAAGCGPRARGPGARRPSPDPSRTSPEPDPRSRRPPLDPISLTSLARASTAAKEPGPPAAAPAPPVTTSGATTTAASRNATCAERQFHQDLRDRPGRPGRQHDQRDHRPGQHRPQRHAHHQRERHQHALLGGDQAGELAARRAQRAQHGELGAPLPQGPRRAHREADRGQRRRDHGRRRRTPPRGPRRTGRPATARRSRRARPPAPARRRAAPATAAATRAACARRGPQPPLGGRDALPVPLPPTPGSRTGDRPAAPRRRVPATGVLAWSAAPARDATIRTGTVRAAERHVHPLPRAGARGRQEAVGRHGRDLGRGGPRHLQPERQRRGLPGVVAGT